MQNRRVIQPSREMTNLWTVYLSASGGDGSRSHRDDIAARLMRSRASSVSDVAIKAQLLLRIANVGISKGDVERFCRDIQSLCRSASYSGTRAGYSDSQMKVLSIRQPWASLIAHGIKDIDGSTNYRGPVLIHAARKIDCELSDVERRLGIELPNIPTPAGGIVGLTNIVCYVQQHDRQWFGGPFGFVLAGSRPLPFLGTKRTARPAQRTG